MAKNLSEAAQDDIDDIFEDDALTTSMLDSGVNIGGRDNSIRRRIEERLERKRLEEELGYLDEGFSL